MNAVLASVNAGYAWTTDSIPSSVSGLNGISCPTPSDCTAVGFGIFGSPVIVKTTDAGSTWTAQNRTLGCRRVDGVSCSGPCRLPCGE